MSFAIDAHTKSDLNIFPEKHDEISIFGYYNATKTKGGEGELKQIMNNPTCNTNILSYRLEAIKFIQKGECNYDLSQREMDFIERYLNLYAPVLKDNYFSSLYNRLKYKLKPNNEYFIISKGLEYIKSLLINLSAFTQDFSKIDLPEFFEDIISETDAIYGSGKFRSFLKYNGSSLRFREVNRYDNLIRMHEIERFKKILRMVYLLDAFTSVAEISRKKNLSYPGFIESSHPYVEICGLYHPFLKSAVPNDIILNGENNLCFLSGANMAGKSTFLKSIGLCVYLSHIGFPVPARSMNTSLFYGLYTTINISDNIGKGYSHYYSEVKRVKDTILMIKEKKKVFVIFDELFRGTNVKDAFDATLMITSGFTKIKNSLFFVSTHIVEVGQELEKQEGAIFKFFDSGLECEKPIYNYKLKDGISSERLGLTIVKNEKIMDIIGEIVNDAENPLRPAAKFNTKDI